MKEPRSITGAKARDRFDRTMTVLLRAPKPAPKRDPNRSQSHGRRRRIIPSRLPRCCRGLKRASGRSLAFTR